MPLGPDGKLFDLAKVKPPGCEDLATSSDEILVCGRRDGDAFRVPESGRPPTGGESWTARSRDMMERGLFDGQTVGPNGYLRYSRQTDYEWRQDRREAARSRRAIEREIKRSSRR